MTAALEIVVLAVIIVLGAAAVMRAVDGKRGRRKN